MTAHEQLTARTNTERYMYNFRL